MRSPCATMKNKPPLTTTRGTPCAAVKTQHSQKEKKKKTVGGGPDDLPMSCKPLLLVAWTLTPLLIVCVLTHTRLPGTVLV